MRVLIFHPSVDHRYSGNANRHSRNGEAIHREREHRSFRNAATILRERTFESESWKVADLSSYSGTPNFLTSH